MADGTRLSKYLSQLGILTGGISPDGISPNTVAFAAALCLVPGPSSYAQSQPAGPAVEDAAGVSAHG